MSDTLRDCMDEWFDSAMLDEMFRAIASNGMVNMGYANLDDLHGAYAMGGEL